MAYLDDLLAEIDASLAAEIVPGVGYYAAVNRLRSAAVTGGSAVYGDDSAFMREVHALDSVRKAHQLDVIRSLVQRLRSEIARRIQHGAPAISQSPDKSHGGSMTTFNIGNVNATNLQVGNENVQNVAMRFEQVWNTIDRDANMTTEQKQEAKTLINKLKEGAIALVTQLTKAGATAATTEAVKQLFG